MDAYKMKLEVDVHDVDYNGIAKTSAIMRYIQSAAQAQLTAGGMSYDNLRARSRAFILSRFRLEVERPLPAYTPLTAVSYPCESRGFSFIRCYELWDEDGTVARAVSVWALLNTENHALVRVGDFELGLKTLPPLDLELSHIKLPGELSEVGGYGVHYGDVDQNMHMNNTKYPDMYSNFLDLSGKMIRGITINYASEAKIGEKLKVERAADTNFYYFRTVRSDGKTNSEAKIELADIL